MVVPVLTFSSRYTGLEKSDRTQELPLFSQRMQSMLLVFETRSWFPNEYSS